MNKSALQHQIANTLATHGKINGMTQKELAEHIGGKRRLIGIELKLMSNVSFSGRGVRGSPYIYKYAPVTVFCDDMEPKYKQRPFKFWAAITMAPLLIGLVSGLMWN